MVVNKLRDRYRVDLVGLQASCEANYARLMRLLPDMRSEPAARRIAVTQGDQMLGVLTLEVLQACPYTTTLQVRQEHSLPWLPVPQLEVQVYHDARMAEVLDPAPAPAPGAGPGTRRGHGSDLTTPGSSTASG